MRSVQWRSRRFALQLGVSERQLRHLMHEAKATSGATGHKLIELLERRLDNVVFRAGFARTHSVGAPARDHGTCRSTATRGHRLVPHLQGRCGERSRSQEGHADRRAGIPDRRSFQKPWIEVDRTNRKATISRCRTKAPSSSPLRVQLVVSSTRRRCKPVASSAVYPKRVQVHGGARQQERVDAVQDATVTRHDGARVLHAVERLRSDSPKSLLDRAHSPRWPAGSSGRAGTTSSTKGLPGARRRSSHEAPTAPSTVFFGETSSLELVLAEKAPEKVTAGVREPREH